VLLLAKLILEVVSGTEVMQTSIFIGVVYPCAELESFLRQDV